jgi:hypothetical protein
LWLQGGSITAADLNSFPCLKHLALDSVHLKSDDSPMAPATQLQRLEIQSIDSFKLEPIVQAAVGLKALRRSCTFNTRLNVLDAVVVAQTLYTVKGLREL